MSLTVLALSIVLGPTTQASVDACGGYTRWAIIGSPELSESGWLDLLTAGLSQEPGLQMLEREQIAEATRELAISNIMGAEAAGARLKLGRLLKTDALLVLAQERQKEQNLLRVIVCDARCGARLWTEVLPYAPLEPGETITGVVTGVRDLRARYPEGVQRIFGVPPLVSRNLVHDYDHLQDELAYVLAAGLGAFPGTAVIETEEAQAIQHELALAGGTLAERLVPAFVRGEFRITETGPERGRLRLNLGITRGDEAERVLEREFADTAGAVEYLRQELPATLIAPSASGQALSIDTQIALLLEQADAFRRLGMLARPIALREAALLLEPGRTDIAQQLVDECARIVRFDDWVDWKRVPPEQALQTCRDRTRYWQRGMELLEQLIGRGAVPRAVAIESHHRLAESIEHFFVFVPKTGTEYNPDPDYAPEVLALIEPLGPQCTALHLKFLREVLPLVHDLSGDCPLILEDQWATACVSTPHYKTYFERDVRKASREELDYTREFALRYGPELSTYPPVKMPLRASSDPDFPRDFSTAELLAFWEAVAAAPDAPYVQHQAEEGLILARATYRSDGQQRDNAALIRELEAWADRAPSDPGARVRYEARRRVENWRAQLTPALVTNGDARRDEVPALLPPVPLQLQPVRVVIVHRDGSQEPLASLKWADHEGWSQRLAMLREIIPCGRFDVVTAPRGIFVQRQPGVLEEITTRADKHVYQAVTFDGKYVWALLCHQGAELFNLDGTLVAHLTTEAGMPPADQSACLEPLGEGEVLAAGALGKPARAWIARLWLDAGQIQVDVFHEATESNSQRLDTDDRDPRNWKPEIAFTPDRIKRLPDPLRPGNSSLVVSRGRCRDYHLAVDPYEHRVEVVSPFARVQYDLGDISEYRITPEGVGLLAYRDTFRLCENSSIDPRRLCSRTLYKRVTSEFAGCVLEDQGVYYAPGRPWVRFDPHLGQFEELWAIDDRGLSFHLGRSCGFGRSALLGLVAWDEYGRFYRVRTDAAATAELPVMTAALPDTGSTAIPPPGFEEAVSAIYRFRADYGLWPCTLDEAIDRNSHREAPETLRYVWQPDGGNRLSQRRHRQEWVYVFGGTDEGGYVLKGESIVPWKSVLPAPPEIGPEERLARIRAEYARRIQARPAEVVNRRALVSYMYRARRLVDARAAALEWIAALPRDAMAREALRSVERLARYNIEYQQRANLELRDRTPQTFAAWILMSGSIGSNTAVQKELERMYVLPFADSELDWHIAELAAFEAGVLLLDRGQFGLLVEFCDAWERNAAAHAEPHESSYVYFRAAALLRQGDVAAARHAGEKLPQLLRDGLLWTKNAEALIEALAAGDTAFKPPHEFEHPVGGMWLINAEGGVAPDVALAPGTAEWPVGPAAAFQGTLRNATGAPVPGAAVIALVPVPDSAANEPSAPADFKHGDQPKAPGRTVAVRTDVAGRFSLPGLKAPMLLAVLHPAGYTEAFVAEGTSETNLVLADWGHIEGRCLLGAGKTCYVRLEAAEWPDAPISGLEQHAWAFNLLGAQATERRGTAKQKTQVRQVYTYADSNGRFVFNQLPPGKWYLQPERPDGQKAEDYRTEIIVESGQTSRVDLLPRGRALTGRLIAPSGVPIDFQRVSISLTSTAGSQPSTGSRQPKGKRGCVDNSGVFFFWDVTPGEYQVRAELDRPPAGVSKTSQWSAAVPAVDDFEAAPIVDLGQLELPAADTPATDVDATSAGSVPASSPSH